MGLPSSNLLKKQFEKNIVNNKSKIAAIILEPLVQCAGGMNMHSESVVRFISKIAKKYNILLILDEIATGFGRTGTMFAYEKANITSYIICLGKAITGGVISLAAVVASSNVYNAFLGEEFNKSLMHVPTYMGNPLACAAANASIKIFQKEPRLEQVLKIEKTFLERIKIFSNFPGVIDVRVKGAIGVIQLQKISNVNWLRNKFLEKGVWIRPFSDVVYLMPCFTIKNYELDKLFDSIEAVLMDWAIEFSKDIK